jgi:hypothetical protein
LQPDEWWFEPELPEKGTGVMFHIHLVDARTAITRELRVAVAGHDFSRALVQALRTQRRLPYHHGAYMAEFDRRDDPSTPSQVCIQRVLHKAQVHWESRA